MRPPPSLTFVDVAKDVQPRLDAPLHRVEQLHAAHPLHLLGDPVQKAWQGRERESSDGAQAGPAPAPQSRGHSSAVSETGQSWTHPALPQPQGGKPGSSMHLLGPCGLPHLPLSLLLPQGHTENTLIRAQVRQAARGRAG